MIKFWKFAGLPALTGTQHLAPNTLSQISHNFPLPEKNTENGSRSSRPTIHTSNFILHTLFYVFRRQFQAPAIVHFFRRSRDQSVQRDTPGAVTMRLALTTSNSYHAPD